MPRGLTLKRGMAVRVEWWDAAIHQPVIGKDDTPLALCVTYGLVHAVDDKCVQVAQSAYAPSIDRFEDIICIPLGVTINSITKMERGQACHIPRGKRDE